MLINNNKYMGSVIEEYCKRESLKIAKKIEDEVAIIIKPRPWYCPKWLYKKIIKDSIEIIQNS